jgi:hypothetical protein
MACLSVFISYGRCRKLCQTLKVYLSTVPSGSVAIMHTVPTTRFLGKWPTQPLPDDGTSPFSVNITVHTWAAAAVSGMLTVTGEWGESTQVHCELPAGEGVCIVPALNASNVSLWWPNNLGPQRMYNITSSFTPTTAGSIDTMASANGTGTVAAAVAGSDAATGAGTGAGTLVADAEAVVAVKGVSVVATRKIGFRYSVLVTINDTYGARFSTAVYTRGCHWFPHLLT